MRLTIKNNILYILLFVGMVIPMALSSCGSSRGVIYFQDLDTATLHNKLTESAIRIKAGDQLTIMVFGPDKYLIMPYNQTLNSVSEDNLGSGGTLDAQTPYDVDKDGYIRFPVIGKLKVSGLTTDELTEKIHEILEKDIKDVTIFVAIENFRVNVLGEVKNPGCFNIKNNTCTFLEALALAGDCTIMADKRKVCLLRLEEGKLEHYYYDLTNSKLLDSKNLFLQQNDVIVVPPTKTSAKSRRSDSSGRAAIISLGSMAAALAGVIISISK